MFECMKIAEKSYEGVVEPSYKKSTGVDSNHAGQNRQMRGESASSNTYSDTSKRDGNHKKNYVDHPRD